jgi:ribosomal protein S18 acetylase RimI-like enzyme
MHLAGTPECEAILQRLGGQPRGRVRMVTLDDEDLRRAHAEPDPSTVRLRFVSPFEASDQAALRGLILSTHARHPDRPPLWNVMVTTLGAWQGDRLVGYVQFSVAPRATYLYGIRVDPELRGQHLGRRLFAGWLQAVQTCHGEIAYGCATPDNTAMRGLFERAGFEADGMISASPEPEVFYVGDARAFAWAGGEPKESLTERGDTPWA